MNLLGLVEIAHVMFFLHDPQEQELMKLLESGELDPEDLEEVSSQ